MICDSHIHMGQFYNEYTSPLLLLEMVKSLELNRYAVSSTTICEENYKKVIEEFEYLLTYDEKRVDPVLWITPDLLKNESKLYSFIDSDIKWKCIKIHPELHPYVWTTNMDYQRDLLLLSQELNLPILIHTGGNNYSEINIWENLVKTHSDQTFIFAHCRPFKDAITILSEYPNAYGDLAFVEEGNFIKLNTENIWGKVLWGSDLPINKVFYKEISTKDYYDHRLKILYKVTTKNQCQDILFKNYFKIFKI